MSDRYLMTCKDCRHYDESAYAYENHHASGRICEHRVAYQPDLSPFRNHSRFPHVTHSGSSCRAIEEPPFEQRMAKANTEGRLF